MARIVSVGSGCLAAVGLVCATVPASAQAPTADHTTLEVEQISQADLDAARATRMSLDHASVGTNILQGMNDLESADAGRYAYPNWYWRARGNPGWAEKIAEFEQWVADHENDYDVFQMKFCYVDNDAVFEDYRDAMLGLEASYPTKTFIWWTMPIQTGGNADRDAFNTAIRDYCSTNDKALFDIADIESHDPADNPVTEGGYEALYQSYTDDGGHLNDVGRLRPAKAMWYVMTQLAFPGTGGGSTGGMGPGGGATGGAGGSGGSGASAGSGGYGGVAATSGSPDDSDCDCGLPGHPGRTPIAPFALLVVWGLFRRRR